MIETKAEVSKDLEKALQTLELSVRQLAGQSGGKKFSEKVIEVKA